MWSQGVGLDRVGEAGLEPATFTAPSSNTIMDHLPRQTITAWIGRSREQRPH